MKEQATREMGAHADAPGSEARRRVGGLGEQMRDAARSLLDEQKERVAGAVQSIAHMLRRTADTLGRENNAAAADYAGRAAAQIDRFSATVRERELSEIVAGTEAFARRQPALFIAGAAAAGFVIGRLLAQPRRREGVVSPHSYRADEERLAGYAAGSDGGGERI